MKEWKTTRQVITVRAVCALNNHRNKLVHRFRLTPPTSQYPCCDFAPSVEWHISHQCGWTLKCISATLCLKANGLLVEEVGKKCRMMKQAFSVLCFALISPLWPSTTSNFWMFWFLFCCIFNFPTRSCLTLPWELTSVGTGSNSHTRTSILDWGGVPTYGGTWLWTVSYCVHTCDVLCSLIHQAPFTQDAEHLAIMEHTAVFTQVASNIKGFAHKCARKSAYAFCVNGPKVVSESEPGCAPLHHFYPGLCSFFWKRVDTVSFETCETHYTLVKLVTLPCSHHH